jgi:hypothetical protein
MKTTAFLQKSEDPKMAPQAPPKRAGQLKAVMKEVSPYSGPASVWCSARNQTGLAIVAPIDPIDQLSVRPCPLASMRPGVGGSVESTRLPLIPDLDPFQLASLVQCVRAWKPSKVRGLFVAAGSPIGIFRIFQLPVPAAQLPKKQREVPSVSATIEWLGASPCRSGGHSHMLPHLVKPSKTPLRQRLEPWFGQYFPHHLRC